MAIQDLINEVNSIQTKKQAIKEAITAKGVTSEGKLSKFADEIKQISTGEPYWCVLNRYRLDNGKEGVCARTNLDKTSYYFAASNSQNQLLEIYPDGYIRTMNGSAFSKKEQACCFIEPSSHRSDDGFDNVDNAYKILDTYAADKSFTFTDFKNYNQYLRPYKENVLVNHNAVYISTTCKDDTRFGDITDKLDTNNSSLMFYPNGTSEPIEYVTKIDSTTFIQMAKSEDFSKAGFIKIGNETPKIIDLFCERIFGKNKMGTDYSRLLYGIYNNTARYDSLPFGNYMWLSAKERILVAVFIGINYVVDINGNKKKNIEIYPYLIYDNGHFVNPNDGDAIELYFNISQQGQKQLQQASSTKFFRKQVLAANGTPEKATNKFLNGQDALLEFKAKKNNTVNGNTQNNLFASNGQASGSVQSNKHNGFYYRNPGYLNCIGIEISNDIMSNNKVSGFIRLNDNNSDIRRVDFEAVTDTTFTVSSSTRNCYAATVLTKGVSPDDDRVVVAFINRDSNKNKFYRIKDKANGTYITNSLFNETPTNSQLYITTNADTTNYINANTLTNIWTEINSLNKDDFEAYSERLA
jgi:hypothetical protein